MSRIFKVIDDLLVRAGFVVLVGGGCGGMRYSGLGWTTESRRLVQDDVLTRAWRT